jgi:hypothetical protein
MFVSQVGPSHWACAGTMKRPKKIGIIALITVDIVALHIGKSADQRWSALVQIPNTFFISHLRIGIAINENLAIGQSYL